MLHNFAVVACLMQLSILYFESAFYKIQGHVWANGAALYYILRTNEFALPGWGDLIWRSAALVSVGTYCTILFELAHPFLLWHARAKYLMFAGAVLLHTGIGVLMGIPWFSLTMISAHAVLFNDSEYLALVEWMRRRIHSLACVTQIESGPRHLGNRGGRDGRMKRREDSMASGDNDKPAGHGWILYDADCAMCTGLVTRTEAVFRARGFGFAPLQEAWVQQRLGLSPEQSLSEMRVLTFDGRTLSGADAIVYLASEIRQTYSSCWAWLLRLAGKLPLGMQLLRCGYRWVAARRSCRQGACALASPGSR